MVNIRGYSIAEQLYNGSRTLVYRAIREDDQKPVVIKLLKNTYPSFNELVQFRNQYTIAKNLNYPGIIQTYSLEAYQNGYALIMEDFGGISLKEYFNDLEILNKTSLLTEFLQIAISLCDILDTLYQQRVIHKDIKPANILINPETKQVKLIDFSIASLLNKETQEIKNPNVLEGTLSYISPEQTGRMNRGIDYRSDFYSLGVTFYELLTGKLPFFSDDAMELVHCHIAKKPTSVNSHQLLVTNKEIPQVLNEIVMKLMAKNAENRYQSALGLKHDLENCLYQFKETGNITDFTIAQRDICDRFIIPDKLYGRENEVEQLLAAFDRVSSGSSEMILVAGFSGIGKTAVVSEVHKPIVKQRGYFIKGKFDQFNRNVPLDAFVQAFRDLVGQLLTENYAQLSIWKHKILQAVGEQGQVIIDVIPELEKIIGKQSSVTELSGTAAQNRFNLLFQKFIQVFTNKSHPLVIFLDDLQWADSASLKLIKLLLSDSQTGYLLMIGAYRDNEVFLAHPLMLTLEKIIQSETNVNTIILAALSQESLNQLVADTLNCSSRISQKLTEIIYKKTKGNPFFSTQFLKVLYEDNLIKFDYDIGIWKCDITQITTLALTDDVVEFMSLQLQKLPQETQNILKIAACIGNKFDLSTLAIISQQSEIDTASYIWKALQEGMILPISDVYKFYQGEDCNKLAVENKETAKQFVKYKFLHDRVQQAAYSLIPERERQINHYSIGRLLLEKLSESIKEEKIFIIVNNLNYCLDLVTESLDRKELAELNLKAGRKAQIATAYTSALTYVKTSLQLLTVDDWQDNYLLMLDVYEFAVQSAYLSGNYQQMEEWIEEVLQYSNSELDKSKVYEINIQALASQGKYLEAIQVVLKSLELMGIKLPHEPSEKDIETAIGKITGQFDSQTIASLIDLPVMDNPKILGATRLLTSGISPTYLAAPSLLLLIVFQLVDLSSKYGNNDVSPFAYSMYGLILCGILQDIETGYEFGKLALDLSERFNAPQIQARTMFIVAGHITIWGKHVREALLTLNDAYQLATDNGDLEYAGYITVDYCCYYYVSGCSLSDLLNTLETKIKVLSRINQFNNVNYLSIYLQAILDLVECNQVPRNLGEELSNAEERLSSLNNSNDRQGLFHLHLNELIISYLFGDYERAVDIATVAENYLDGVTGMVLIPVFYFYQSLVELAHHPQKSASVKVEINTKVTNNQKKMKHWSSSAPMNFQHKYDLVEAEYHRIAGKKVEAIELYDKAIFGAKENEYIQEEALANELAAKFYLDWGKEKAAVGYMQEAYYCYARWGAKAKTDDLEKRYPQLLKPILEQQQITFKSSETIAFSTTFSSTRTSNSSSTSISDILDFSSVLKAAQNISSNIELDELITNLTKIILENSGAKKSVLILPQEDSWQVRAITFINHQNNLQEEIQTILDSQSIETCQDIPIKIINYVKNTQKTVVVDNCQTEIPGIIGEYMREHQPKSILCTPIIDRGNLVGILYLENKLASGVFTKEGLQVINLLSSQAAISLENAQLYQQAQQALEDLQQAQLQIVQSEKMSALGNLVAGVAHEMNNPLGFISASLKQAKPTFADIIEHLQLYQESLPEPDEEILEHAEDIDLDYSLEDLPKVIDSMVMACDRLKNISTSLRTFSRADKDYKVTFNIHEGIDSTILILKHRLKANDKRPAIEVITDYGDLPQIECFPGQLNQVFMNILANAIDALEYFNTGRSFEEIKANPNQIIVKTSIENNSVKITIADNGKGMSEETKNKIFEHLFTTKGVGKGTGLGLAIAKQIIEEKHGGKLSCNSVLGEGTEFILEIPTF
ncbi:MAG: ATP-binding sensor histidine kinase [Cyanobacteria bacterium P01_A01_bin.68]